MDAEADRAAEDLRVFALHLVSATVLLILEVGDPTIPEAGDPVDAAVVLLALDLYLADPVAVPVMVIRLLIL